MGLEQAVQQPTTQTLPEKPKFLSFSFDQRSQRLLDWKAIRTFGWTDSWFGAVGRGRAPRVEVYDDDPMGRYFKL